MKQLTNAEIIEAIERYQNYGYVHPLTCGNANCREILEAAERDGQVVLVCPTCGLVQTHLPPFVIQLGLSLQNLPPQP